MMIIIPMPMLKEREGDDNNADAKREIEMIIMPMPE
jgi:hypothetical protein